MKDLPQIWIGRHYKSYMANVHTTYSEHINIIVEGRSFLDAHTSFDPGARLSLQAPLVCGGWDTFLEVLGALVPPYNNEAIALTLVETAEYIREKESE